MSAPQPRGFARLRSLGPAIIVASVVLGPGSILASSRVGTDFGYDLVWVVLLAAALMLGMTALCARLGVTLEGTLLDEIARGAGRPLAALVGVVLFLVVACFQFSNNVAVVAALEALVGDAHGGDAPIVGLVLLNLGVAGALLGLRRLYRPVEVLLKILMALMIVGFVGNVFAAQPAVRSILAGLVPKLPEELSGSLLPHGRGAELADPLLPVVALVGTTLSVAGAFYQAYLVREKGWTRADLRRGLVDSVVGISVLGLLTLLVMVTAAAVLHGEVRGSDLGSAADVARLFEPLLGAAATALFALGLLAGALSSFLVNVMIGGTLLSDGLGLGGRMDRPWPKAFTVLALAVGMSVAIAVLRTGRRPVELVVFAQALTVLGNPILAGVLVWLALRRDAAGRRAAPAWMGAVAALGFVVVALLALHRGLRLFLEHA